MSISTLPLPSHRARAGQDYVDENLAAWSSWPAPDISPDGWFRSPLGDEAAEFFRENGFLVLENALTPAEIAGLNHDAARICRGEYGMFEGLAPAADGGSDEQVLAQYLCIHFPHKISPVMRGAVTHPGQVEALTKVIGPNVKCMQSMLFIKGAGKPGQAWHQDEYFIPTRDRSLVGGWMALDDATVENGCLWVIPGSHKRCVIWPQHKHDDRRFDCTGEAVFPYENEHGVPVEVKAGSIVFFHGYLLHRSLPNKARAGYRRCLVNHYMNADSLLPWYWTNTAEAGPMSLADHRDILLVAGEDPYAWKGVIDVHRPTVRPTGEGGCGDGRATVQKDKSASVAATQQMGGGKMGGATKMGS